MIRYTAEHLWVRLEEGEQGAIAGITRHAQDTLGDIVLVDVTARGAQPENTVIGTVESVKTASDLHMPLNAGEHLDQGGNQVKAAYGIYAPDRLNLHSNWDGAL
ncbi:MAG: hypothetical protein K2Q97_01695, partial [Burkholderiaceae bacterium]|nr:hypothetical protein [Burkholderiaceae bacterium]